MLEKIDQSIHIWVSLHRSDFLTQFFYIYTILFDFSLVFLLVICLISFLIFLRKGKLYFWMFTVSIYSSILIVLILKNIFNIARPENGLANIFGASFPSYHATIPTVLFIMLNYIFYKELNSFWRFVSVLLVVLVAISRIYLGVHWFSDVFVGVLLGVSLSYVFILIFRAKNKVL